LRALEAEIGGGVSWDERVAVALAKKKAEFLAETAPRARALDDCKKAGVATAEARWEKFREMLLNSALGGGMSFDERVRQAVERKGREFNADGKARWHSIHEAERRGLERSAEEWRKFKAQLLADEDEESFDVKAAREAAQKSEAFKERVRKQTHDYHKRLEDFKTSLEDRPLMMKQQSANRKKGIYKMGEEAPGGDGAPE